MAKHRFHVGERVECSVGRFDTHVAPGTYTIIKTMPGDSADPQYRVKSEHERHERVMNESRLRKS